MPFLIGQWHLICFNRFPQGSQIQNAVDSHATFSSHLSFLPKIVYSIIYGCTAYFVPDNEPDSQQVDQRHDEIITKPIS